MAASTALPNVRKDSGWAWMTVLGCFIMNFLVVGAAAKSFGILYVELIEMYNASSSATLSVVAISQSLCMLLGPVANMLAVRFTSRRTVMAGGLLMGCGFILTMFPPSIVYLYFSYGLLVGVGSALAYSPTIVVVGQYFERRRALANGLSVAGSGVGNFIVPQLMRVTVDHYGFQGALLILSGIVLHVCVAGALLRPLGSRLNLLRPAKRRTTGEHGRTAGFGDSAGLAADGGIKEPAPIADSNAIATPEVAGRGPGCGGGGKVCCARLLEWNLLTNAVFLVYGFAAMLIFTGYPPLYIMLPDHARMIGIAKSDAAFLVSILGLSDVVGRIGFGFVADLNVVPKRYIFVVCMAVAGCLICALPVCRSYVGLAVLCAATGLSAGTFFTLLMVVLAEKLGVHRLHSAFGLAAMFMGVSFFYSAPITGALKDATGTWTASYVFSGVSILSGALVLLLDPLAARYEQRKNDGRRNDAI